MGDLIVEIPSTANEAIEDDLPAVFLPYQQKWVGDESHLKIAEKSRRIGLTWAEAADNVLIAASSKDSGGMNVYYIGYNQDMAIEYIEACAMWARAFNYAAAEMEEGFWDDEKEEDKNIKTYTIKFPESGHRIVALSSRPSNLRGKQGVAVLDEAAFHDNLKELIKAALAFLIWGGKVRIISTHDGEDNPFNELVNEIKNGVRKGTVHRYTFKEAVEEGLYKRVCMRLNKEWTAEAEKLWVQDTYDFYGDDATEELDVVPKSGSGSYIPSILIEKAMYDAPVLRLERPDSFSALDEPIRRQEINDWIKTELDPLLDGLNGKLSHFYGQDFARKVDLSVIAPIMRSENLVRWVPFVLEMRNIPTRQQEQILWHIIDRLPRFTAGNMDATGNGETLAEYTADKYGSMIQQTKLNDAYYGANMPVFKSAFEDGLIKIPRHADIRRDLRSIAKKNGIPKLSGDSTYEGEDGKKRHGDAAIALFLSYVASLSEHQKIESQSTGIKRSGYQQMDAYSTGMGGHQINDSGFGSVGGGNDFGGFL